MNPENTLSIVLVGENLEYVLFKTAIGIAETGLSVWLVSHEPFEKVPDNINPPDKEILQLITFVYLKDYKDLISHLNGIHLWHKIPDVIVVAGFDEYCGLYADKYNSMLSALVATTILDSAATCAKRKKRTTCLLLACAQPTEIHLNRFKVLQDMYFPNVINKIDDDNLLVEEIINRCLNK